MSSPASWSSYRAQFVAQADAATLVTAQIHHHATSCLGDQSHRFTKLRSTVALDAAEHVAGQAFAVHPDEHGVVTGDVTDHEREVGLTVEHALEGVTAELAPLGRQPGVGGLYDEFVVAAPVADEIGDRHEDETVLVREPAQVRAAGHLAAVEDEFAEHAGGSATGEPSEVDGCLGVADALQHAAGAGAQREDVPGAVERVGADRRIGEGPQRRGAIRGRDARRSPLGEVDGDGEGRSVRLGVLVGANHGGEVEVVAALAGQADTDDAGRVTDEERDRLGRGRIGGHDQVAFVLAVLVVGDDDDLAAGDRRDRVLDRVEHRLVGFVWVFVGVVVGVVIVVLRFLRGDTPTRAVRRTWPSRRPRGSRGRRIVWCRAWSPRRCAG